MMKKDISLFLLLTILICHPVAAQDKLHENAKVSLLTASPWHGAIYALFGHTAIRVHDDSTGLDAVFNYGYFDQSQPDFIYNFVRGKTDYILGVDPFENFLNEYAYKGQEITEQTLNLTLIEKQRLYDALYTNALPENRRYRYDFFYDNCATRPRDMLEKYNRYRIQYPETAKEQSFRDLVHECVDDYPWIKFGIDLLIGSGADHEIDVREKMFLPSYLMNSFEGATFQVDETMSRPILEKSEVILPLNIERNNSGKQVLFTPFYAALALLALSILVSFIQAAKLNKSILPKIYDILLFTVAGLGGTIIFILMYFSEHPATNPNWNFAWINCFALIVPIFIGFKPAKNIVYFYHFINFVALTLFLLLWWLVPQVLPLATIPFSLSLWIRSGANLLIVRQRRIRNRHFTSSSHLKAGWGQ